VQALSTLLATQARAHLMPQNNPPGAKTNHPHSQSDQINPSSIQLKGLSLLLEAALQSVPQQLLEDSISQSGVYRGHAHAAAAPVAAGLPRRWEECMGCALISDKVAQCLRMLQLHRVKVTGYNRSGFSESQCYVPLKCTAMYH
jgi:hypothetical protein